MSCSVWLKTSSHLVVCRTGQATRRLLLAFNSSATINQTANTHATVGDFIQSVDYDYIVVTARAPATKEGIAAAKKLPANADISVLAFPSAELQLPLCKVKRSILLPPATREPCI